MESTKSAMEDVGLQWNPKKRVVAYVHTHTHDALGLRVDKSICNAFQTKMWYYDLDKFSA